MVQAAESPSTARTRALRVLVVEDSEIDYEFLLIVLRRHGLNVQTRRVETREAMRAALREDAWDIVVSDHNLPAFSSLGALETLRESGLDLPFIIVSGEIGEDAAVAAMRAGVDDYLLKDRLARLVPAIDAALERAAMRQQRRSNEENLRSSEARLSALTAHLENIKEKERASIARDLHDDIGGALAAIGFELTALAKRVEGDATSARSIAQMREQLDRALGAMQRMMMSLRPGILDAGLVAALEWLVRDFARRTGLKATFSSNREEVDVSSEVSTAAFRICQESLTNVLQHADAGTVRIELFADGRNLTIEIRDNGRGIDDADLAKGGVFGLVGMRERARGLGGWLEIDSAAEGTAVMLCLPTRNARG